MKKRLFYPVDVSQEYFNELIKDTYPEVDKRIVQSLVETIYNVSLEVELDLSTGKSKILGIKKEV